jgi:membrane protein YdbS with pleckstrin-like domain
MEEQMNTTDKKAAAKAEAIKAIERAFWLLITAAYLLISFLTGRWGITWIIFVLAAALKAIFRAVMVVRDSRSE